MDMRGIFLAVVLYYFQLLVFALQKSLPFHVSFMVLIVCVMLCFLWAVDSPAIYLFKLLQFFKIAMVTLSLCET